MRTPLITRALIAAFLCGACGGDEEPTVEADSAPAEPRCLESDVGGAQMPLHVGRVAEDGFLDIADGQEVELLWGNQGFLMILFDIGAEATVVGADTSDAVCFQCSATLSSPTAAFPDAELEYMFYFSPITGDLYSSQMILILTNAPTTYDGATALLTASCDGHERSGSVERTINLSVPPPPVY